MDGVGIGPRDAGDAVHLARKPFLDDLWARSPTRTLRAHGRAVGLPSDDDMGNSEVGHNALGAGRVFEQGAKLVNNALASGALFAGRAWRELVDGVAHSGGALHFLGLLSDGNVHSHIDQLIALLEGAARDGVRRVFVHALADGRDVPEGSFEGFLARLEDTLAALSTGGRSYRVASGGGRMFVTMDRYEADWRIVERGWRTHVLGDARPFASAAGACAAFRAEGRTSDQTLPPFVVADRSGAAIGPVVDGDAFVFFNFRGDRAIEITRAFDDERFTAFDRVRHPRVCFAGLMQYDGDLRLPRRFLVGPPQIDRTMGCYLAANGLSTFACAETQKYGHVTYFWNGNRSGRIDEVLETYVEIPSDRVPFDERPWMKAAEVTDRVIEALAQDAPPRFIRINYANGDMVGHTGDLRAATLAVEAVDLCLGRLAPAIAARGGCLVVTADHGNADDMWQRDKQGRPLVGADGRVSPKTSHTLCPVPISIRDYSGRAPLVFRDDLPDAGLAHVAATAFALLGLEAPGDYEPSLVRPG